jgi:MoaA/NifB/PqqE/SkfB family radical SAM enzyme
MKYVDLKQVNRHADLFSARIVMPSASFFVDSVDIQPDILQLQFLLKLSKSTNRVYYHMLWSDKLTAPELWHSLPKPHTIVLNIDLDAVLFPSEAYEAKSQDHGESLENVWLPRIAKLKAQNIVPWLSIDIDQTDLKRFAVSVAKLYQHGIKTFYLRTHQAPKPEQVKILREAFASFRMKNLFDLEIYFDLTNHDRAGWEVMTACTFSGLKYVHLDLSNRCTHSCEFCGMYSNAALKLHTIQGGGSISALVKNHLQTEIKAERALEIISSLPETVTSIQFGGLGDPMIHDSAVQIIKHARLRGFQVNILSNMEYLNEKSIEQLHEVGSNEMHDFHFIANVSGVSQETYLKTRPRQKVEHFNKVTNNLKYISKLRKQSDGFGIHFIMMCVVTSQNFHELDLYVEKAAEWGASAVHFKPFELHSNANLYLQLDPKHPGLKAVLKKALALADQYQMRVQERFVVESILKDA